MLGSAYILYPSRIEAKGGNLYPLPLCVLEEGQIGPIWQHYIVQVTKCDRSSYGSQKSKSTILCLSVEVKYSRTILNDDIEYILS